MKFSFSKYVWFDGKFVPRTRAKIPVTTHAIHYGTSIFEGIRAYWSTKNLFIFRLKDHIRRFRNSGNFYHISLNFSDRQIENAIINLCRKNRLKKSCYIRPFYFVGQYGINLNVTKKAPTHVAIITFPFGDLFNKNGISATISKWRKFSDASTPTQAKMGGNYLNSILATQDAKQRGFNEAILLDQSDYVSEAPGENIFLVKNNELITPSLNSSALNGITRKSIIAIAKDMGLKSKVRKVGKNELKVADEIFLSGTAAEITPVIQIDKRRISDSKVGNITKSLITAYSNIVMNKNEKYSKWLTKVY